MKYFFSTVVICGFLGSVASAEIAGEYGLHLFFNEKEFVDVITIEKDPEVPSGFTGKMIVPDDFTGPLRGIEFSEADNQIKFKVLVPKNGARPEDLVFLYKGKFFDKNHRQLIGYVTIQGQQNFVASFVAFQRGTE